VGVMAAESMFMRDRRSAMAGRSSPGNFVRTRDTAASNAPRAGVVIDHKSARNEPRDPVAVRLNSGAP